MDPPDDEPAWLLSLPLGMSLKSNGLIKNRGNARGMLASLGQRRPICTLLRRHRGVTGEEEKSSASLTALFDESPDQSTAFMRLSQCLFSEDN